MTSLQSLQLRTKIELEQGPIEIYEFVHRSMKLCPLWSFTKIQESAQDSILNI